MASTSLPPAPTVAPAAIRPAPTGLAAAAPALWKASALAVCTLTSALVVVLWFVGGGMRGGGGPGINFTAIGALAGLVGSHLLLLQIVMLARIPIFERGLGRDVLIRIHRWLGFAAFWLIVAHVLLVVHGARLALGRPATGLYETSLSEPGVPAAFVGTGLLVVFVIFASVRQIRKRLRYEIWHLAHAVAYIAAALSLPHQVLIGGSFINSPVAAIYWWSLWGVAFAATLVWRVAVPIWRTRHHDIRVADVRPDGTRGIILTMRGRNIERLAARGGQFFTWRFGGSPGWTRGHPISLCAPPLSSSVGGPVDTLQIAVRVVGDGTRRMAALAPGTRVGIEGPYGNVTGDARHGRRLLMFGAGAGVGPMMAILAEQDWEPGEAVLIARDNSAEEAMMRAQIEDLVTRRGLICHEVYGPPNLSGTGPSWLPPADDDSAASAHDGAATIREWAKDIADTDVFVCGPPIWMKSIKKDLLAAGIPATRIHTESFDM